jgi:long-chain-fatty-acid--CoA ligase ACSBG
MHGARTCAQVYGMSECTGVTTASTDIAHVWGSCGWPTAGVEVKIFKEGPGKNVEAPLAQDINNPREEEQGEVCFRGRHIMMGYMANPDLGSAHVKEIQGKNAEAIDNEGWLHSGDKGCMDVRGCVKITGRYKELIIGAGGENIAPVPIEDNVKKLCPAVSNFMMVGDKRKFNVALVTLKAKGATGELPGGDELDGDALGLVDGVTSISLAATNPVL